MPDASPTPATAEPTANILLVDDRPANLVALEATLAPLGQRVIKANSGEEALKHLLIREFALILMDVQMPGLDGFETAALIKEHPRTRQVPIIFITAISREAAHVFKGYQHGAVDYLLKPFDADILRSKAAVFIDLWRKEKELQEQAARLRERDKLEHERRVERRFREMVDALPLCVWALRKDGTIEYHNEAWRNYAGLGSDVVASPVTHADFLHPDDRDRVTNAWNSAVASGQRVDIEFRLRHASNGEYRWHIGTMVPQRDDEDAVVGWVTTATDIDNQKRAEEAYSHLVEKERQAREAAEAANRAKDEFLATVSHELRTPLNAMVGWTRMLRTRNLPPAKQMRALETIERNAQAQTELIEDLLDVSRIITGKLRLEVRPVDLVAVIDAALDSLKPAAESRNIVLERSIGELPDRMSGDPGRLQQIVWNLLSNAIKFSEPGGRVQLRLARVENVVTIDVIDEGRGIDAAFLPYVFDRFRQHDSSSKRSHGGLGLGLAIVRHLAELHGGTVDVTSQGEGFGATFTVRLPIRAVQTASESTGERGIRAGGRGTGTPPPPPEEITLDGIRVLVVDDEPDARELLTEVLQDYGAESAAAGSAEEALGLLASFRPNVLVSDIGLPGEDGYALIGRIRALPPGEGGAIPALALTAYARSEDAHRALACGFHQHAVKPIAPADLARLVRSLFSHDGNAGQIQTTDGRARSDGGKDDTSSSAHPAV